MALNLQPVPPFSIHGDTESCGTRWTKWLIIFNNYIRALDIKGDSRKIAILLHSAGEAVLEVYSALPGTSDVTTYEQATTKLTEHFAPKKNITYEVFRFRQEKQQPEENVNSFCTRLRNMAHNCEFGDAEGEIKAQVIQHCRSSSLRRRALGEAELTLEGLLKMASIMEVSEIQAKSMENQAVAKEEVGEITGQVNLIKRKQGYNTPHSHNRPSHRDKPAQGMQRWHNEKQYPPKKPHQQGTCINCGFEYPHAGGKNSCPANKIYCNSCNKKGHYSRCCLSTRNRPQHSGTQKKVHFNQSPMVRNVQITSNEVEQIETEHLFSIQSQTYGCPMLEVKIAGHTLNMVMDTGATANVVNHLFYKTIATTTPLQETKVQLFSYGASSPLNIIGSFKAMVQQGENSTTSIFYVLKEDMERKVNVLPILGYPTMKALGLLERIQHVRKDNHIMEDFPDLFQGMGKMINHQVKLHINPDIRPVAQPHRRIPFHLRPAVEKEIQNLLTDDIIETVTGPTPWVSPIVVIPKGKDFSNIRICVDMRQANQAIIRERHPMTTIEDIIHNLNGAKFFSKLDLQKGYHQIELTPESRYITVFSTHIGLFQYKRLSFGISSAAEVFGNMIYRTISDIQGCVNSSDDLLVFGKNEQDHDEALHNTLTRLRENNLTLNKQKCEFKKQEIVFHGHKFSASGISLDPSKSEAVRQMTSPRNADEVRSLLGFATYCSRFIPRYAEITEPLRKLTRKNEFWKWEQEEEQAMKQLKESLAGERTLSYFDHKKLTILYVDASPSGLGGILTQKGQSNDITIIGFSSRALTPTESRYSQTEREALAVVVACEHFSLYLIGSSFVVVTDHLPLLSLLGKPTVQTSARIERWNLRLQSFYFTLQYQQGKLNPADYLSRHAQDKEIQVSKTEQFVHFIAHSSLPKALSWKEIQEQVKTDPTLQHIQECLKTNQWHQKKEGIDMGLKQTFQKLAGELSVFDGVLLKGHKIVIPSVLQRQILELAHEGHMGVIKTKQLLRSKVWFYKMDQAVETMIGNCIPCLAVTPTHHTEPLHMSTIPPQPWQSLAMDFCGPFPNGKYIFVLIDEHSRFPLAQMVTSTKAETIIPILESIFCIFGFPKEIKSDNGPPFNGQYLKDFMNHMNISHRKITPLWPKANGIVERFMAPIKKILQTVSITGHSFQSSLQAFLVNYRNTPHCTTKKTPFELLFKREMQTKLPSLTREVEDRQETEDRGREWMEIDKQQKANMKKYSDLKKTTRELCFREGDLVLVRQKKINKLTPYYNPEIYTIIQIKGTMIVAKRGNHIVTRNSSFFKLIPRTAVNQNTQNNAVNTWLDFPVSGSRVGNQPRNSDVRGDLSPPRPDRQQGPRETPRRYTFRDRPKCPKRWIEEC